MDYQNEYLKINPGMHLEDSMVKVKQIIKLLSPNMNVNSLLDVACGAGAITLELSKILNPKIVTGLDISKKMIDKAKILDTEKRVEWVLKDIYDYKIKEKFDLVTCVDILEHTEDDLKFLKKVRQLGKYVIIKTPLEDSYFSRILRKTGIFDTWADTEKRYGHVHHYNESELVDLTNKSGLKIVKMISVPMLKRSKPVWEFFRLLFYPIAIFSINKMVAVSGGFKILLLKSDD